MNGKSSAVTILQFELYPPHLCAYITLSSTSNANIVEWLVSISAVQVSVDSALTICFGSAIEEIMFFMCFFKMIRVWGCGFQPGGYFPVFCGSRDEFLINIFIITSIFCISYMEPLFAVPKTVGLPGSSAVNNFVLEGLGLVNVAVSHWRRESNGYSRSFSNSWKLILSPTKNLTKFVLGMPWTLRSHSDCATVTWQKW